MPLVILVGVRINCLKSKNCNIDLNLQLADLFKKLTLIDCEITELNFRYKILGKSRVYTLQRFKNFQLSQEFSRH